MYVDVDDVDFELCSPVAEEARVDVADDADLSLDDDLDDLECFFFAPSGEMSSQIFIDDIDDDGESSAIEVSDETAVSIDSVVLSGGRWKPKDGM